MSTLLFPRAFGRTKSFTLLELLVVMGIIAILAAILLPTVPWVRKRVELLKCQSNLSAMYKGFHAFALDHNDRWPGNYYTRNEREYWKTDWLSGQGPLPDTGPNPDPATIESAFKASPERGTVFPYIGKQSLLLRCPSLPEGPFGQGKGSNGRFDYSMIGPWAGAITDRINSVSRFKNPQTRTYEVHPTPLLVEEAPEYHINSKYVEGCHGHIDKLSRTHDGRGTYAATDGSVHVFAPPPDACFWNWELLTPSGKWWTQLTDLQNRKFGITWGEWNNR